MSIVLGEYYEREHPTDSKKTICYVKPYDRAGEFILSETQWFRGSIAIGQRVCIAQYQNEWHIISAEV